MAAAPIPAPAGDSWRIAVVEDEEDIRGQICHWLGRMDPVEGKSFQPTPFPDFDGAWAGLMDWKFDIVILDIFRGHGGVPASPGLDIMERIKRTAFVPLIVYTALPERVTGLRSPMVRVVGKVSGLGALEGEVRQFLAWRLPQLARALRATFDDTLRDYMWRFVDAHWDRFESMVDKPDFGRLVVQRLSEAYTADGSRGVLGAAYGPVATTGPPADKVHPASVYVMPVPTGVLRLGDIRVRRAGESPPKYLVVLQPSCDTVRIAPDAEGQGARDPNVDRVLCARAYPRPPHKSDHDYPLPAFLAVPDLMVEFHDLEIAPIDDLLSLDCVARVASPFAEQLAAKFAAYIGRIGTPEIEAPPAPAT
ncbi:MAG: hypothetical protein ACLQD8_04350 [Thermoplasmata archaeon]